MTTFSCSFFPEETESHFQPEWQAGNPGSYLENSWEEQLLEQQDHLEKEMEEAKKMISGLQVIIFVSAVIPFHRHFFSHHLEVLLGAGCACSPSLCSILTQRAQGRRRDGCSFASPRIFTRISEKRF